MKKKQYFIALAALAMLSACSGKKTTEPLDSLAEENAKALAEGAQESACDSSECGPVIEKKYKGTLPAASGPGIVCELTLSHRENNEENGIYDLKMTYLEAENGKDQTFASSGKRQVKHGTPADGSAVVYALIPDKGDEETRYFLSKGDSLTLLNQELEKAASGLNYTLKLVP